MCPLHSDFSRFSWDWPQVLCGGRSKVSQHTDIPHENISAFYQRMDSQISRCSKPGEFLPWITRDAFCVSVPASFWARQLNSSWGPPLRFATWRICPAPQMWWLSPGAVAIGWPFRNQVMLGVGWPLMGQPRRREKTSMVQPNPTFPVSSWGFPWL